MLKRKKIPREKIPNAIAAKWSHEVLDEGFTPLPKRLLRCLSTLFAGRDAVKEMQVVFSIADYLRPELARGPSIAYLAFNAGLDREEFRRVLNELVKKGWITIAGPDEAADISINGLIKEILKKSEEEDIPKTEQ
jgi:hypothetical protein